MASRRKVSSARERTDTSLELERRKADDELVRRSASIEADADAVVARARDRVDEVLRRARARADQKLEAAGAGQDERTIVDQERRREDALVRQERVSADAERLGEREEYRRALAAVLEGERKRTDQSLHLERSYTDEMIGSRDDVVAIVSHDLRNMLGGIALSAESLRHIEGDARARDKIDRETHRIRRYTAQMARLVGDLVDLVSIEAGHLAISLEHHDVADLVRETMDAFLPLASVKKISLTSDMRGGSLRARHDHNRVLQVLANLVGNAIKFTPEGGEIALTVEAVGDDVRFAVRDTGPGIDADKLDLVFERFRQLPGSERSGRGLGLYISKCIVEAHGGRIWAESQRGAGSTFYFTLPIGGDGDPDAGES